jgi:hypothetical protein
MGHAQQDARGSGGGGSPLTTLTVAWMVVVGLAFAPVGAYYFQSHNILVLLAFTGASFVIGLALFVAMGLARMGSRAKSGVGTARIADLRARGNIFGRR